MIHNEPGSYMFYWPCPQPDRRNRPAESPLALSKGNKLRIRFAREGSSNLAQQPRPLAREQLAKRELDRRNRPAESPLALSKGNKLRIRFAREGSSNLAQQPRPLAREQLAKRW